MPSSPKPTPALRIIEGGLNEEIHQIWLDMQEGFLPGLFSAIEGGQWEAGLAILQSDRFLLAFDALRGSEDQNTQDYNPFNERLYAICNHFLERLAGESDPIPASQVPEGVRLMRRFLEKLRPISSSKFNQKYIDTLLAQMAARIPESRLKRTGILRIIQGEK